MHNSCIDYEDIDDIIVQAIKKLGKEAVFDYTSYEKARNVALKIVGTIDNTFVPVVGRLSSSYGFGKIIGRQSSNGLIRWRVDFDPIKGFHINVEDFRKGKGDKALKYALKILDGGEDAYKKIIDSLNR